MGSRVALWWRPITNTWARSTEDPHCAGINYSLPCLHKFRDCYQLWGTFLPLLCSVVSGVKPDSEVCWCCWGGTKCTLSIVKAFFFLRCPLMRLFILPLESQTPCLRLINSSWSSLQVICSKSWVRNHTSRGSRNNLLFGRGNWNVISKLPLQRPVSSVLN